MVLLGLGQAFHVSRELPGEDHIAQSEIGQHGIEQITGRVVVTIMEDTTTRACPDTISQYQAVVDPTAWPTRLRRREPSIGLPQTRPIPGCLVLELSHELGEPSISNRPCQPPVDGHTPYVQCFHRDRRLGSRQPRGELVQKIGASSRDPQMQLGNPCLGFVPVLRSFLAAREFLIGTPQRSQRASQRFGRGDLLNVAVPIADCRKGLEPQIDSGLRSVAGHSAALVELRAVDFELEGHPPATRSFAHRRSQNPGGSINQAVGKPRHVLARSDRPYARQPNSPGTERFCTVSVVTEPIFVLACAPFREPYPGTHQFSGPGFEEITESSRAYPTGFFGHPRRQLRRSEPRKTFGMGCAPLPFQCRRGPWNLGQLVAGESIGLLSFALGPLFLNRFKTEVLDYSRQPGMASHRLPLLQVRCQFVPHPLFVAHPDPPVTASELPNRTHRR